MSKRRALLIGVPVFSQTSIPPLPAVKSDLQSLERDDRVAAIRAAETAGEIYRALDDDTGMHNAATLRAASELEIAAGMTASTQGAEQRALYETADRRLTNLLLTRGSPTASSSTTA